MTTLRDLPDEQFFCLRGADGHDWEAIQKPQRYEQWGIRVHKLCTRCGKEQQQIWDRTGTLADRHYDTPEWHLRVTVPYNTGDVRVEYARRLTRGAGRGRAHAA